MNRQLITIGEIIGVHGVKGYLKIRSFAQSSTVFSSATNFLLSSPDTRLFSSPANEFFGSNNKIESNNKNYLSSWENQFCGWYEMIRAMPHKKGVIALFKGVTRENAETLVGKNISVAKHDLPELESDTYYWEDIVGLNVIDIHSGYLGVIDYIIPTGSNDVFVVKEEENEVLIPALAWVVLSVDLHKREMIVDLPDGLKNN